MLPNSGVTVHLVELGPLTVVVVVAACERTTGVLGFLWKYVSRVDLRFLYQGQTLGFDTKGRSWVFDKPAF